MAMKTYPECHILPNSLCQGISFFSIVNLFQIMEEKMGHQNVGLCSWGLVKEELLLLVLGGTPFQETQIGSTIILMVVEAQGIYIYIHIPPNGTFGRSSLWNVRKKEGNTFRNPRRANFTCWHRKIGRKKPMLVVEGLWKVTRYLPKTWICLRWLFTDCTMINHFV